MVNVDVDVDVEVDVEGGRGVAEVGAEPESKRDAEIPSNFRIIACSAS